MSEQVEHIRFSAGEVEVAASDGPSGSVRTIAGLAVPYNVEAEVWPLGRLEFAPGSVELAGRVPFLLGHDTNRPVGILATQVDSKAGMYLTFKIDRTGDGDAALEQAGSGSRAGLSVGADIVEFEMLEEGELTRVTKAKVTETSLVALAAFDSAAVDAVAAQRHHKGEKMTEESTTEAAKTAAAQTERISHLELELAKIRDERPNAGAKPIVVAEREPAKMRLGEYVQTWIRAEKGDTEARTRIEAALTREVVGNEPGVVPIAYAGDLIDGLGTERPLFDAFSRAEMPGYGMTLRRPKVNTRPNGDWLVDDTAGAPSGAVAIGNLDVPVLQWAWGGSASVALVERSSPSYVEEVFKLAADSYVRDVEAKIAATLSLVAAGSATSLGEAVADYLTTTRQYANIIVAGATAYGLILDSIGPMRYSSGSADATGSANLAGLRVVPSADVAAADAWVTHSKYLECRESSPIRLTVSDVSGLSVELGLTSFFSCLPDLVPNGAVRISTFTPPAQMLAAPSKGSK